MTKNKTNLMLAATLVTCLFLFCVKWTGGIPHLIVGLLLLIAVAKHTLKRLARMKHRDKKSQAVDWILMVDSLVILITGFLMHPLSSMIVIKILHGLSSIIFVILVIVHVVQHFPKKRKQS